MDICQICMICMSCMICTIWLMLPGGSRITCGRYCSTCLVGLKCGRMPILLYSTSSNNSLGIQMICMICMIRPICEPFTTVAISLPHRARNSTGGGVQFYEYCSRHRWVVKISGGRYHVLVSYHTSYTYRVVFYTPCLEEDRRYHV